MKKKISEKEKGNLDDFLPIILFIMLMATMLFMFIGYNAAVNQKTELNAIGRKYSLRIETYGYLTPSDKTNLVNELNEAGFYTNASRTKFTVANIDNCLLKKNDKGAVVARTTMSDVGYGNEVTFAITVYSDVSMLKNTNVFEANFKNDPTPISVSYKSTSKE